MASKSMLPAIKDVEKRKCQSWIKRFVEWTSDTEAAPIFRKWSAITAIAATLEQKVYLNTHSNLYPNLYIVLVGNAGIGKSRSIVSAANLVRDLGEVNLGATSMT